MAITMLIIAILSLIATVAVAFVIFFLQVRLERNSRKRAEQVEENIRKRDLANQARLFILDNTDEIEYLTLAQVATAKQSARKVYSDGSGRYTHKRKFYSIYHRCEEDLQKEIIRQSKFNDYGLEKYNIERLIDYMLDLFEKDAKKLGILDAAQFLYEGGKYFHRGIDHYGETELTTQGQLEWSIWRQLEDFMDYKNHRITASNYTDPDESAVGLLAKNLPEKRIYSRPKTFKEFEEKHATAPLDQYWYIFSDDDERQVTFVVMEMIRQGVIMVNHQKRKGEESELSLEFAEIETYEDLYYATVLTLYCAYYDQVKDLDKLKVGGEEDEQ